MLLLWLFSSITFTAANSNFDLKSYQSCISQPLFDNEKQFVIVHGRGCQYTDFKDAKYIGHGHSSIVYSSVDAKDLPVALKTMNIPKSARMFRNEECMLAALQHPTIPRFHCSIRRDDEATLVMELIDGTLLFNALISDHLGPLPIWRAIAQDSAELLHFLHLRGIVLCDFKPENIIIMNNGVRIIDFGTATLLGPREYLRGRAGTPQYMAPEMVAKELYDGAVDWYDLGLTLYEMVMRHYPFTHDDLELLAMEIAHGIDRTALPDEPVGDLIFGLMAVDPRERWNYDQVSAWLRTNF